MKNFSKPSTAKTHPELNQEVERILMTMFDDVFIVADIMLSQIPNELIIKNITYDVIQKKTIHISVRESLLTHGKVKYEDDNIFIEAIFKGDIHIIKRT